VVVTGDAVEETEVLAAEAVRGHEGTNAGGVGPEAENHEVNHEFEVDVSFSWDAGHGAGEFFGGGFGGWDPAVFDGVDGFFELGFDGADAFEVFVEFMFVEVAGLAAEVFGIV